jgi:radical SAM superfamily enzyme YgiQ (UPF0313 family)
MPSVILFRPAYDRHSRSIPVYPWALLYLASVLRERGVGVHIIDEAVAPDYGPSLDKLLDTEKPAVVGISSMTGDQIRYGLQFARRVREKSRAAIVWGGIHPSPLPEQTARHPLVDYAVAGEGEYVLAELVQQIASGKKAVGMTFHKGYYTSTLSKTFFDCFYKPQYSGGYSTITKALYESDIDWEEFITYFELASDSLCQRTGYVLGLMAKETNKIPGYVLEYFKKRVKNNAKLIPGGSGKGTFIKEWKILDNVGKNNILAWWYNG